MGGFKDQVDDAGAPGAERLRLLHGRRHQVRGHHADHRTRRSSPPILGLPSFSIQSPTALKQYDANNVVAEGDSFVYPAYAIEHPTGTGPFKFQAYDKANNTVTLVRNDDYWGEKAKIEDADLQDHPG